MAGISIPVGIKNAQFKAGLDEMRRQAKTFAGDIKGEFIGSFSGIKSALVGAFGLGAAVEGLSALMEKYGKVQDMAERLGETAESVQRVGQVATESGTDVEMIAKAMSKLTVEANKATHAGTEQAAMFDTLGINAAEFRDAPLEGKLIVLADAWERNTATGEGTAQMLELLGNRAQQLIPLLIAGPEELRKKLAEVSVASNAAVGIIDQMGDAWSAVKNKGTAASAEVVRYGRYLLALNAASVRWLHGDLSGMRNLPGTWKGMRAEDKSFDTPKKRGTGADEKLAEIEAEQKAATEREKQHEKETKAVIADAEKIIGRQRQLETELESLREKHRLAAMTDEERLAALREREKQLILAGGGTPAFQAKPAAGYVLNQYDRARATHEDLSPTAPLMDAREKALETGKEIERQEEEIAAKKKRLETEIAKLTEDYRLAGMTDAQRLIALLEKQKKLIAEGWNPQIAKPGEKQLEARKGARELAGPIREQQEKAKATLAESLAKEREGAAADKFAKMTPAQKRTTLGKQRDSLYGEATDASGKGEELTASQKRLAAAAKQKEIDALTDDPLTGKPKIASISVDSMQAVGGGGGIGSGGGDPQLRVLDKIHSALETIVRNTEPGRGERDRPQPK